MLVLIMLAHVDVATQRFVQFAHTRHRTIFMKVHVIVATQK